MKIITRTSIKLMLLQFMYFVSLATLYSFTLNILTDMGYGAFWAGILRFSVAGTSIVSQMIRGYLADTFVPLKKLIIIMLSASAALSLLVLPLIASTGNPLYLIIGITVVSFLDRSNGIDMDIWSVKLIEREKGGDFAFVRSSGSAGYAVSALVFGFVIAEFGSEILYYCHGISLVLTVVIALTIPSVPCQNRKDKDVNTLTMLSAARILVANRKYVKVVAASTIMFFAMNPVSTFLYLYVIEAGGDSSHLGIALLIVSIGEMLSMAIASNLLRRGFNITLILGISLLLSSLRSFTLSIPMGIWPMVVLMVFQGLSYGSFARLYAEYMNDIIPGNIMATATTWGNAISFGGGVMAGSLVGSLLIGILGLRNYSLMCGLINLVGVFIMVSSVKDGVKESGEKETNLIR